MNNNAIYVNDAGSPDNPVSIIGECQFDEVPFSQRTVLLVESPDADRIYALAGSIVHPEFRIPSTGSIKCRMSASDAAEHVLAACGVDIVKRPPFRFRVVSDRRATASP